MIGLRSLRNRLAVVFGLIVLGAIGTIYLTVTPRLQERLRNQKLERLLQDARSNIEGTTGFANMDVAHSQRPLRRGQVTQAATGASAEVLILDALPQPVSVVGKMDSAPEAGLAYEDATPLSVEAARA